MDEIPSLFRLCMEAIGDELLRGDDILPHIQELPSDLFDCLLTHIPPVALQKLQDQLPFIKLDDYDPANGCFKNQRKRRSFLNFEIAWRELYKSRWPGVVKQSQPGDLLLKHDVEKHKSIDEWQLMYWETHLQNCLDAAAEIALLPSFDGCIGEIELPDVLIKCIGYDAHLNALKCDYSKLSFHCQQFGSYVRWLRLQNVLCVAEISHLLRNCKLQWLVVWRIKSKEQVEGLCKLLSQNTGTLTSLDFIHCKLSSAYVNAICDSLSMKSLQTHGIQHLSIKMSSFLETNLLFLPVGLAFFMSSGRSLSSLSFCDNNLQKNFARMVLDALLDASSSVAALDLSENNISGWLSHFKIRHSSCSQYSLGMGKSLQSLRLLNLRSTNLCSDDADCLKYAMVHMPNLEIIDLSDNPVEDDGVRNLIPYFVEMSERNIPFANLKLENCQLSYDGVGQLLDVLSTFKRPLKALSVGENDLGSKAGALFGKFLCTGIRALNIQDIGLGSSGFLEAQEEIMGELKLVYINISMNRGGVETAKFLSKLFSCAPELLQVSAEYNFMPAESLPIICTGLKDAKGKVEHLDFTGNTSLHQLADASQLDEFEINGKPIIIFESLPVPIIPYDDDP